MPRKPSRKTLKSKCDTLWAKIIKWSEQCEWCGEKGKRFEAAHIFTRTYLSTRWDLENGLCLCSSCHRKAHSRPLDFGRWVEEYIGGDIADELSIRAKRFTGKVDLEAKYKELKEIYDKLV